MAPITAGRLLGARIALHPLFLAALALYAACGLFLEAVILFSAVFLHEFGHVAAARRAGIDVAEVELLPFGGVAKAGDLLGYDPLVEIAVALAGPLVNGALILGAVTAGLVWEIPPQAARAFFEANAVIGGFNLLPALPLDGGRVLRALLARRVGFRRATRAAVGIGRAVSLSMLTAGIVLVASGRASASFVIVPAFVFLAAGREEDLAALLFMRYLVRRRSDLRRERCRPCRHLAAGPDTPLKEVVWEFVPQCYHMVWVVTPEGGPAALASEMEVLDAVLERGMHERIGRVARPF